MITLSRAALLFMTVHMILQKKTLRDQELENMAEKMNLWTAAAVLFFKIILPTIDVYSDWAFGVKVLLGVSIGKCAKS